MSKTRKSIFIVIGLVVVLLLIFLILRSNYTYNKNDHGQTYGSLEQASNAPGLFFIKEPDLIAVMATNGKTGYVKKTALLPGLPVNPKEALELQRNKPLFQSLPVYEKDGITLVGTFKM